MMTLLTTIAVFLLFLVIREVRQINYLSEKLKERKVYEVASLDGKVNSSNIQEEKQD